VRIKIKSLVEVESSTDTRENMKILQEIFTLKYPCTMKNVKEFIMKDNLHKIDLPLYVLVGLVIVKFLYYNAGLISEKTFRKSKGVLLDSFNESYILLP
jgi:hypothetical protein